VVTFYVFWYKLYTMSATRIHTIAAVTFLLDFIFYIKYDISFVGQFLDVLLIFTMFVSALTVIFNSYKNLSKIARFYYSIYPVYLVLLVITLGLRAGLLVVVLLIPFLPFIPQKSYVESPSLQIRAYGAPLGSPAFVLYKRYILFEKKVGQPMSSQHPFAQKPWKNIILKSENKDSINVGVTIDNKDTVLTFYQNDIPRVYN
jgi:hypothetical protein